MKLKSFMGLSLVLAKMEFKLRNEGTYLGMLWYLLNPLLMFFLLFFVFSKRLGADIPYYPLYLLLGIIIFNFFQHTTTEASQQIIKNDHLIKSIRFPYASLIGCIVLKTIFSHIFEIIIFGIFMIIFGVSLKGLILYPIILFFLICFTLGISLFFSSISVYFADFNNIWTFISRLLWFATPIFYSIEKQARLIYFNSFNPMYYFITAAREILIYQRLPSLMLIAGIIIFSTAALLIGLFTFNKLKNRFAEML